MRSWCRLWMWTHFASLFALSQSWQVSLCLLDPWAKSWRLFIIKAVVRNQWVWLAYSGPCSEEWGIAVWRSDMVGVEVAVGDLSMLDKLCLRSRSSWILVMVPLSSESRQACPHAVHLATLDCWLFPDLLCVSTPCALAPEESSVSLILLSLINQITSPWLTVIQAPLTPTLVFSFYFLPSPSIDISFYFDTVDEAKCQIKCSQFKSIFRNLRGSTMFTHAWNMQECQEYLLSEDDIKY